MSWWHRESSRQLLAALPVPLCLLLPGDTLVRVLAGWDLYAVAYLLLTWLAFRHREPSALRAMALASRRRRLTDRLLASPPEQLSQGAAVLALVATVIAMPQAESLGAPVGLALAVCVAAVVSSWLVLQTGFVLLYLGLHAEGGGLEFPGDAEPVMIDFVYLAVAVGTSYGTPDVTITQSRVRRHVATHGVLGFLFNTLVLAAAVTLLVAFVADP